MPLLVEESWVWTSKALGFIATLNFMQCFYKIPEGLSCGRGISSEGRTKTKMIGSRKQQMLIQKKEP